MTKRTNREVLEQQAKRRSKVPEKLEKLTDTLLEAVNKFTTPPATAFEMPKEKVVQSGENANLVWFALNVLDVLEGIPVSKALRVLSVASEIIAGSSWYGKS